VRPPLALDPVPLSVTLAPAAGVLLLTLTMARGGDATTGGDTTAAAAATAAAASSMPAPQVLVVQ
jgi:hypothetical protein